MARKRILCIEDNDSNMRLVSRIVEGEKHDFLRAVDGLTALSLVRDVFASWRPCVNIPPVRS